jgi:hypothetical protein
MPVHREPFVQRTWIGVDLNSTGHFAIISQPDTSDVFFYGEDIQALHRRFSLAIEKCRRSGRHKQARRLKHHEHNLMREMCLSVGRELILKARLLGAGIKLERLSGKKPQRLAGRLFPRDNTFYCYWFVRFQKVVQRKALSGGIPVAFVDPSGSSKRCSACGGDGYRKRKIFVCRECGMTCHADANAAFNIAISPVWVEYSLKFKIGGSLAAHKRRYQDDLSLMPWEEIAGPFWRHLPAAPGI